MGLLHQPAHRVARGVGDAAVHRRVEGPGGATRLRPPGVRPDHGRARGGHLRAHRGPPIRMVDAEPATPVRDRRLDLAVHADLGHPVHPRVRGPRARHFRDRRDASAQRRQVLPVRLHAVALPRLPLRQPCGHDRFARRIRAALRAAAVPPGRPRLHGLRDRPRVPLPRDRGVRRRTPRGDVRASLRAPVGRDDRHGARGRRDPGGHACSSRRRSTG